VHFDFISNIFFCRYASRTLRMKLLTWCRVIRRAFRVGPGSGLSLSKYFGPAYKIFFNIKSRPTDIFLSWRRFVVITAVASVSELFASFFSANSVCEHSYVFLFSPGISLTLFLRRTTTVSKLARDGVALTGSMTHTFLGLF